MIKNLVLILLLAVAAGVWFYLDHLNSKEQLIIEQNRQVMNKAREEAASRAAARARFEAGLVATLSNCKEQADQAKTDFLTHNRMPEKHKPGEFSIPETIVEQAEAALNAAYAECQFAHDTRFALGQ